MWTAVLIFCFNDCSVYKEAIPKGGQCKAALPFKSWILHQKYISVFSSDNYIVFTFYDRIKQ